MRKKFSKKKFSNPRLFRDELESLNNSQVWIFIYGKSLRIRLNVKLVNRPSSLINPKIENFEDPGFVGIDNKGNEIFFTTSLIEKIEIDPQNLQLPIIYLRVKTFGIYE